MIILRMPVREEPLEVGDIITITTPSFECDTVRTGHTGVIVRAPRADKDDYEVEFLTFGSVVKRIILFRNEMTKTTNRK